MQAVHERPILRRLDGGKNHEKIVEKLFKNLLTNPRECGILFKSPTRATESRAPTLRGSLTIEQQEIKVQARLCEESRNFFERKESSNLSRIWAHTRKSIRAKQARQTILTAEAVWIQFVREFDPGSGWTLAACITHSSRTVIALRGMISGGRVSNAWATCPCVGDTVWKRTLIPHNVSESHGLDTKDLLRKDGLALD